MIDAFLASLQALDFILITAFVLNPKLLTFNAGARTARISSSGRRRFRQYNSLSDTLFLTFITFFAFGFIATGAASLGSQQCSYEDCAHRFTEGVQIRKVNFGPNIATCLLLNEYNACLNKSAAGCRGDLRFLTLTKIARYYDTKFNCSDIKCPVCHKVVPSDDVEYHLVVCLTRPRLTYNEDILNEDKGECPICFDDMCQGDTIARLPCLCVYHKGCIDSWFKIKNSCPEHPSDD